MHFAWFWSTFLRFFKFLQIKEGGTNFWGKPILQKVWIIWSPLHYFKSKSFLNLNSSSFIKFQCILHDSGVIFSESRNFYKLKRGDPILQKVWIIWSPLLYFNFESFLNPNSLSFIRFQYILHDWGASFAEPLNIYKLKTGDLIYGGNQFCRKFELFGPLLCISILKVFWAQILRHSLDFNASCMIQEYFSQSLEISTN